MSSRYSRLVPRAVGCLNKIFHLVQCVYSCRVILVCVHCSFTIGFPCRPPPMAVCRQCPTYRGGLSSLCSGASVPYTCPTPASHIMCRCCLQFMPLRPSSDDVPSQKCALCEKYYCNAYWQTGCNGLACRGGCLLPLKGL